MSIHTNTHRNTQKYAETHTRYTTYIDFCFTHICNEAHMSSHTPTHTHTHANVHTLAWLNIQENMHIYGSCFSVSHTHSHTESLTPQASPFGDHLDSVLSVATMRALLWDKMLLFVVFFFFSVLALMVEITFFLQHEIHYVLLPSNQQSVISANCRNSYHASVLYIISTTMVP